MYNQLMETKKFGYAGYIAAATITITYLTLLALIITMFALGFFEESSTSYGATEAAGEFSAAYTGLFFILGATMIIGMLIYYIASSIMYFGYMKIGKSLGNQILSYVPLVMVILPVIGFCISLTGMILFIGILTLPATCLCINPISALLYLAFAIGIFQLYQRNKQSALLILAILYVVGGLLRFVSGPYFDIFTPFYVGLAGWVLQKELWLE